MINIIVIVCITTWTQIPWTSRSREAVIIGLGVIFALMWFGVIVVSLLYWRKIKERFNSYRKVVTVSYWMWLCANFIRFTLVLFSAMSTDSGVIDLPASLSSFESDSLLVIQELIPLFLVLILYYVSVHNFSKEEVQRPLLGMETHSYKEVPHDNSSNSLSNDVKELQLIDVNTLKLNKRIGWGSFGEVYQAIWEESTTVAVKILKIPPECYERKDYIDLYMSEIKMISKLYHPNIVQFLGAAITENNIYLVTEYMGLGSVGDRLKREPCLPTELIFSITKDTAAGMNYLHKREPPIIHCDLKPSNLLMAESRGDIPLTKIADFGSARILHVELAMPSTVACTAQYCAPEIIKHVQFGEKVDVYSFGVILWQLIMGKPPYEGLNQFEVGVGIQSGHLSLTTSLPNPNYPALSTLVSDCLRNEPHKRPSFSEICKKLQKFEEITFPYRNLDNFKTEKDELNSEFTREAN